MASRKLVSWRLESLEKTDRDKVNAWLEAQSNIQLSLTNVVQHMIDRFGIVDIMKYDVQKTLYISPDATVVHKPLPQEPLEQKAIQEEPLIKESTMMTIPLPIAPEKEVVKVEVQPKPEPIVPKSAVVQQKSDTVVQGRQNNFYEAFSDNDL